MAGRQAPATRMGCSMKRFVLLCLCTGLAQAEEVYKYIDAQGHVTYTNIPTKGAQRIQLTPLSSYRQANAGKKREDASGSQIDSGTQKQRDSGRRKILEQELSNEQKALGDAQKALEEGKAVRNGNEHNYQNYLNRIQQLQDNVTAHLKNIAALKQELGQGGSDAQK